jgi:Fe-S-cluster-containing dehydrogenase component
MTQTWGVVIDVARCHDCNNCFLACKDEFVGNDWPAYSKAQPDHGQRWMNILRRERGGYPLVAVAYLPKPCQHCKNPPCLKAARKGAVAIREDGIVLIDPEKAAGQKQLVESCPYGAIYWNETSQLPQKCSLCAHLLDEGWNQPRCVQACPTGAMRAFKLEEHAWQQYIQGEGLCAYLADRKCGPRVLYKNLKVFTHGFIAGSVALADTDECAENARVTLTDAKGQTLAETSTDNYGDFKLQSLEETPCRLCVEIEVVGRPPKSVTVNFEESLNLGTIII